jgi:hypothetical protein
MERAHHFKSVARWRQNGALLRNTKDSKAQFWALHAGKNDRYGWRITFFRLGQDLKYGSAAPCFDVTQLLTLRLPSRLSEGSAGHGS